MGNYAVFRGCASRDALTRRALEAAPVAASSEPEIEAKYTIPLFWLAGFAPEDLVMRRVYEDDAASSPLFEYVVPCAAVRAYATRARSRHAAMLSLVPAALGGYFEEWIRFVERRYSSCVMIETGDLFAMDDYEECGLRLRGALRALQAADGGDAVRETAALQWFANFEDLARERLPGERPEDTAGRWRLHLGGSCYERDAGVLLWPARTAPAEVALAASLPEAVLPAPGTPAADEADVTAMVRSGVVRDDPRGRLSLALQQLSGEVPLGVDAPTRRLRKVIGGGGELLAVVRAGLFGFVLIVLGSGFIWASLQSPVSWMGLGLGAVMLGAGVWLLRAAWRAQRRLRAIMRA
ncbi:hypothetical protein [Luteitalea sp.]|uniref:hypothetical protein n=1 Tax=Luteitalea sp. TaxID=2004800 RepID=UPI0025C07AEE|nr:hypothetical protein [Luteitalea sp.]